MLVSKRHVSAMAVAFCERTLPKTEASISGLGWAQKPQIHRLHISFPLKEEGQTCIMTLLFYRPFYHNSSSYIKAWHARQMIPRLLSIYTSSLQANVLLNVGGTWARQFVPQREADPKKMRSGPVLPFHPSSLFVVVIEV